MAEIVLPPIPDITVRAWRDDADFARATDLLNREIRSQGLDNVMTVGDVRNTYENSAHLDLRRDAVFVEIDGTPVGFALVRWHDEIDGPRVYRHQCYMHPDWRNRGIGTAMLDWAIAHIVEMVAEQDVESVALRASVWRTPSAAADLLESFGYQPTEHFAELIRPNLDDIPEVVLPDGIEIRPVEQPHLRAIFEADWEAFRDHWGQHEASEEDWRWFLDFPHRDESLWKVAWAGDRIVGQVRGNINKVENEEMNRRRGWCEEISTLPDYRRQGIATALICATLREFAARGMTESALGVHVENKNRALGLYTSLGFEVDSQGAIYEKALHAKEGGASSPAVPPRASR